MNKGVFRKKKNRLCVFFDGIGYVPTPSAEDDVPVFKTSPPRRIGDNAIVYVEGQRRLVMLLKSSGMEKDNLWLVDMGRA